VSLCLWTSLWKSMPGCLAKMVHKTGQRPFNYPPTRHSPVLENQRGTYFLVALCSQNCTIAMRIYLCKLHIFPQTMSKILKYFYDLIKHFLLNSSSQRMGISNANRMQQLQSNRLRAKALALEFEISLNCNCQSCMKSDYEPQI